MDGRSRHSFRPMELELGIVSHASGSARLRLANTDILVGVKTEIDVPTPEKFDEGHIEFFIDCSANATPEFEGRGGEELANEIRNTLESAYQSPGAFDLRRLCILPRQQCWKLFVDVLVGSRNMQIVIYELKLKCEMYTPLDTRVWRQCFRCGFTGCQSGAVQHTSSSSDCSNPGWRIDRSYTV